LRLQANSEPPLLRQRERGMHVNDRSNRSMTLTRRSLLFQASVAATVSTFSGIAREQPRPPTLKTVMVRSSVKGTSVTAHIVSGDGWIGQSIRSETVKALLAIETVELCS
jgi:hypothetical protein